MWDVIAYLLLFGAPESTQGWSQEEKVTFICPVPGYDRHFSMLADFGIEMVTVPMNDDGPDVPAVEALVRDDPSVKGMWVVPTYANPSGAVCSQEVAAALASMPTAAPTPSTTSPRRRPRARTSSPCPPRRVTRTGR